MVWRHGRTAWNALGRFQGQIDVPLDDVGLAQARRGAQHLASLKPSAIVSSDLERAATTAAQLADITGVEVTLDRGLRETDAGSWQGHTIAEIETTDAERFHAWRAGADVAAGGAETRSDLARRGVAAVERALDTIDDDGLLVAVTHGGLSRALIGRMLGLDVTQWGVLGGLSNCSWSVLGETAVGWRLTEHNAASVPEPVIGDDR